MSTTKKGTVFAMRMEKNKNHSDKSSSNNSPPTTMTLTTQWSEKKKKKKKTASDGSTTKKKGKMQQRSPLYKQWKTNDEVEEVVRLKEDLLAEQSERQALDEEIKILRDYVRYRSQKILKQEEKIKKIKEGDRTSLTTTNRNGNDMLSRHEEWSEQDRIVSGVATSPNWNHVESKEKGSLPRLWQMPWNERYELMSKSCVFFLRLFLLFFRFQKLFPNSGCGEE